VFGASGFGPTRINRNARTKYLHIYYKVVRVLLCWGFMDLICCEKSYIDELSELVIGVKSMFFFFKELYWISSQAILDLRRRNVLSFL